MYPIFSSSLFNSYCNRSLRPDLAEKNPSDLTSSKENVEGIKGTSYSPNFSRVKRSFQEVKGFFNNLYSPKKCSEPEAKKSIDYTNILKKLENKKIINFNKIASRISYLLTSDKQISPSQKNYIRKYFYKIENALTNLWAEIAVKTDGFKNPAGFAPIELTDDEIEAWLDLKKFTNAAVKKLLVEFLPKQLPLILASLTLSQLTDLSADLAPTNQQSEKAGEKTAVDIDQAIHQAIVERLLNALQRTKNILSYSLSLQGLSTPNLSYWPVTAAASSLNQMQQLTKAAEALRMLTRHIDTPPQVQTAIHQLYEQLVTDIPKHENTFNLQKLQELKKSLLIFNEYKAIPPDLNQKMIKCWHNLCERLADDFHKDLINSSNAQHTVNSANNLLIAYTELNASSGKSANIESLKEFIDCSIKKLNKHKRDQLASALASAPITELREALSHALNTQYHLTHYPIQREQIEQISTCFQASFESEPNALPSSLSAFLQYLFTSTQSVTDYLNHIQKIFKIEIPTLAQQEKGELVRVLRGEVPAETVKEIQKQLQTNNEKTRTSEELMRGCQIDSQYITDAPRGLIKNSAFNGKRIFDERKESAPEEMQYIVASLLKDSCGSDASAYLNQTIFNLIDRNLPVNKVITLPGGKAITALPSKHSMTYNVISHHAQNSAPSTRIEVAFERTNIENALTDDIEPIPLESKENYVRWNATLEIAQNEVTLADGRISFDYSL